LESLYEHWRDNFYGGSLNAFLENVSRYQSEWSTSKYYSRTISIVQSSGTGKSRLVDEIGKEFVSISFALRLQGETGYPPGDFEITDYLRLSDRDRDIHGNIVGLLAGVIKHRKPLPTMHFLHKINGQSLELMCEKHLVIVSEWYTEYSESHPEASQKEIAREWHDLMAPAKADHMDPIPTAPGRLPDTRSRFRQQFCKKILETAYSVWKKFGPLNEWVGKILDSQANISPFFTAFPVGS
jgi:hypothetical protein